MNYLLAFLLFISSAAVDAVSDNPTAKNTDSCEALASLKLPSVTITSTQLMAADSGLPAFCQVAATLTPSKESDIKIEVWMPIAGWNGKFQAVGNGAFSGAISYGALAEALRHGYAAASTDTGHAGGSGSFALGHPEKVIDFGWRAVHQMTVTSKKIIATYYHASPKFSYWNGCSAGGRQGMKEAQRFPDDFDGIVAGAPGGDWTGRAAQAVRVAQTLQKDETARLTSSKAALLHRAVLEACDSLDGLKDGLIEDPQRCKFDPGLLQCKSADESSCLTPKQVTTARLMYSTGTNSKTKREITGLQPGSELGWTDLGWTASARATGLDQFRFLVFHDPQWNIDKFNFESDLVHAEESDQDTVDALDPNLKAYFDRGGKLIHYHGWSDPQISPGNSTQYYGRVLAALGGENKVQGSYRLFMAPGMAHCGGGEGPNTFDAIGALESWVERGKAPDQIMASHFTNNTIDRTRPLCPYPQVAQYKGTGSTDDGANFSCRLSQ